MIACEDTRRTQTLLDRHGIARRGSRCPSTTRPPGPASWPGSGRASGSPWSRTQARRTVSDPGGRLVAAAAEEGLAVDVLPGASAVVTAATASGLAGGGFVFAGFLPRTPAGLATLLDRLDAAGLAIVAFESPHRLAATLARARRARPGSARRRVPRAHEASRGGAPRHGRRAVGGLRRARRRAR